MLSCPPAKAAHSEVNSFLCGLLRQSLGCPPAHPPRSQRWHGTHPTAEAPAAVVPGPAGSGGPPRSPHRCASETGKLQSRKTQLMLHPRTRRVRENSRQIHSQMRTVLSRSVTPLLKWYSLPSGEGINVRVGNQTQKRSRSPFLHL